MVEFRNKKDSLGFMKTLNIMDPLSRLEVDNLQRIIAEGRDQKTLIFEIDGQMIDPSLHVREGNPLNELKGKSSDRPSLEKPGGD